MRGIKLSKQDNKQDKKLFYLTFFLVFIGVIAVADASAPQALNFFNDRLYFAKQQAVWALVGLTLLIVVSRIHYTFWKKVAIPLFLGSLFLLVLVLIPGIGERTLGARRWFSLGSFSFQPSEIVKLTLALYLAKLGSSKETTLKHFIPLVLTLFLIMLQPDLGTTIVVAAIGASQIFISGINVLQFLLMGVGGGGIGLLLVLFSDYRRERLLTFLKATTDPLGTAYHIRQILLALGSGGFFGVGLGQSRQKYLFLPEAATDSVFAVIAEELGFLGGTALILVFVWFIFRGLKIAQGAPDPFSKILSFGLVVWISCQVFLNIGSMVALVPLTGIPLPFVSYGGSALVTTLIATGILLNISKYVKTRK